MLKQITTYISKVGSYFNEFRNYFSNKNLVLDFLSKLVITLGVVLIVGGLYLMINPGNSGQGVQTNTAAQSIIDTVKWIPGIPFNLSDLSNCSVTAMGLAFWTMGINLLLIGLGLWVRHRLARLTAITVFFIAMSVQFIQFLLLGIMGSPASIVMLAVNGLIIYLLFFAG